MKFLCEKCSKTFSSQEECKKHEKQHELEELKKSVPDGAIICPDCNGTGDAFGSDGCDYRCCYTCLGKKFVIPKKTTKITYQHI